MTPSALVVEGSLEPLKRCLDALFFLTGRALSGGALCAVPPALTVMSIGTYAEADETQYQPEVVNSAQACQCVSWSKRTSHVSLASGPRSAART